MSRAERYAVIACLWLFWGILAGAVYAQQREDPLAREVARFAEGLDALGLALDRLKVDLEKRQKRQDLEIEQLKRRLGGLEGSEEKVRVMPATSPVKRQM